MIATLKTYIGGNKTFGAANKIAVGHPAIKIICLVFKILLPSCFQYVYFALGWPWIPVAPECRPHSVPGRQFYSCHHSYTGGSGRCREICFRFNSTGSVIE